MVVHTRLRERKERERKKDREERCNRRRNALSTQLLVSVPCFYLTKQTRSMNHPGTHDTISLFDFGTLFVCVCVFVCAVTTWAGWAMMQLSSPRKKCTTSLQFSNLIGVNFFKQLIQSECVKCETLSLQYGICWRGLVNPFSKCCLPSQFGPCWFGWSRLWNEPLENRFT
jgi:hypothetical protein